MSRMFGFTEVANPLDFPIRWATDAEVLAEFGMTRRQWLDAWCEIEQQQAKKKQAKSNARDAELAKESR